MREDDVKMISKCSGSSEMFLANSDLASIWNNKLYECGKLDLGTCRPISFVHVDLAVYT